jgi:YggT family protein
MILLGNLLAALARILHIILWIYMWIIIIRAIVSWVNVPSLYPLVVILHRLTEPALRPLRRFIPPHRFGGIDITPMIAILIIIFVDSFIVKSLALYAQQLLRESSHYF